MIAQKLIFHFVGSLDAKLEMLDELSFSFFLLILLRTIKQQLFNDFIEKDKPKFFMINPNNNNVII